VHDSTGLPVQDLEPITNGDLRNSSPIAPDESANPGGMTSSGAAYSTYDVAAEGLSDRPEADGFAMNTENGYVYFADAGSALEQALATSETFSAFARVKRTADSGDFEMIMGRPDAVGAWHIGVDANDQIVFSMGDQTFDTGVQFEVGAWHDIGFSYNGSGAGDSWVYAYIDGTRRGAFLPGAMGNQEVLHLGAGASGGNQFRGLYDHVEFWDYAVEDAVFAELSDVAPSGLPGDYTGDGSVDAADYVFWRYHEGESVPRGTGADGTGDGVVDATDRSLWVTNFGRTLPPAPAAAEPTVTTVRSADATAAFEPAKLRDQPLGSGSLASDVKPAPVASRLIGLTVEDAVESRRPERPSQQPGNVALRPSLASLELVSLLARAMEERGESSRELPGPGGGTIAGSSADLSNISPDVPNTWDQVADELVFDKKEYLFSLLG
jgi:hypothetical protein